MKDKYIEECKTVQQNCTYTAETHHILAAWHRFLAILFQTVPAIVAAVTGALVAAGVKPPSFLWATVASSIVTAVATVMDPGKQHQAHLEAAKSFTTLKHDARFMHEAQSHNLSDEAFAVAVENLHDRYNTLVKTVPATTRLAFELARWTIGEGRHDPDRDASGAIK